MMKCFLHQFFRQYRRNLLGRHFFGILIFQALQQDICRNPNFVIGTGKRHQIRWSYRADRDADAVLSWVVRAGLRGEFKQSEVHLALRSRFTKKERLIAALQRLQANGALRHEQRKNQGARPSDVWHINPRLFLQ